MLFLVLLVFPLWLPVSLLFLLMPVVKSGSYNYRDRSFGQMVTYGKRYSRIREPIIFGSDRFFLFIFQSGLFSFWH